jgi:hypothetical protein
MESNLVQSDPFALHLLSILCHLPDGAFRNQLEELTSIQYSESSARTLKGVGLIYEEHSRFKVLSPIRGYIFSKKEHALCTEDKAALIRHYTDLAWG